MGSNPIEAATNNKEIMKYDRFNLEEQRIIERMEDPEGGILLN